MLLETLQLPLPCTHSPSRTAPISDTVFFTWYVHLCLPKPLETILKSAFHIFNQQASLVEEFVQNFHHPLSPFLFFSHIFLHVYISLPLPHMLTHILIFPFSPPALLSCCISYRWPPVRWVCGRFSITEGQPAPSMPPACSQTPVPGPAEALSQAAQRDTWPNHRNTSSCRLPDAHHGENSGQRWRSGALLFLCIWVHISTKHLSIKTELAFNFHHNKSLIPLSEVSFKTPQSESGWTQGVGKKTGWEREQQLPFLYNQLTWKTTLCLRLEAITLGVRFKTFVCQHDRREQGCNLMRGLHEGETLHGKLPTDRRKERPLSVARTRRLAEMWLFSRSFMHLRLIT